MNVSSSSSTTSQTLIGLGALALAAMLAYGAQSISGDAGYAGVGPNFLPWVVSGALAVLGGGLVWEARRGGFRDLEAASGAVRGVWRALAGFTKPAATLRPRSPYT
ncbi:MAG: tripartite tricarboxylate transporter TctB family protein [Sphingomonadaceae bacterium]|nr:tripartite tricarboxylate transporter TctB family protein [Sphingomonadaceae bacterium]